MFACQELKSVVVLVTRPKPAGEELCQLIEKAGGEAVYFPTIAIAPPQDLNDFETKMGQLASYDWIIFTSPQAVYHSIKFIEALPKTVKIAAIGMGTAQALKDADFTIDAVPKNQWNSEGLLSLPELSFLTGKKIAIIKGDGGREFLASELARKGAQVTLIAAYKRVLPSITTIPVLDLLRSRRIDVIICTSSEGLHNLTLLLQEVFESLKNLPLIVISERMLTYATELGFKKIVLAKNASHDALLYTLVNERKTV